MSTLDATQASRSAASRAGARIVVSGATRLYRASPDGDATVGVTNVSLDIAPGEFVALVGPSGSGKTTLLNLVAGLDRPDSGRVTVDDVELTACDDGELARFRRDRVGVVFQDSILIGDIDVTANIALPLMLARQGKRLAQQRTRELLDELGLAELARRMPGQLSGGQRQLVAVARALANSPPLIVADEPTGSLDSARGQALVALLRRVNARGATLVVATHSRHVSSHARRVLTIRDGRLT